MFFKRNDRFKFEQLVAGLIILMNNFQTELNHVRVERKRLEELVKEVEEILKQSKKPQQTYV